MLATVVVLGAVLWALHYLLLVRPKTLKSSQRFYRQLAMLGVTVVGVLAVILALPVAVETRNQIVQVFGLVMTGAIAFSSTTVIANFMGGIVLRTTGRFCTGDYITVDGHFGRVTERGLLDTEIQTETRELVALPNAFLLGRPVSVVRSSGAMVSVELSLGYDVHHAKVERLLLEAAARCGLAEAFVQVRALGDHAVTYRVNGLLEEVKRLLTMRSTLSAAVLDVFHEHGVEIVSPGFMNQRRLDPERLVIARSEEGFAGEEAPARTVPAEKVVFDKAEGAKRQEKQREALARRIEELTEAVAEGEDEAQTKSLKAELEAREAELRALDEKVKAQKEEQA